MTNHPESVRNEIVRLVVGALDGGSVVLLTSGGAVVARLGLGKPAFADPINGQALADTIIPDAAAPGGLVAKAELRTPAGAVRTVCAVTEKGKGMNGDIELNSLFISKGQTVGLDYLMYVGPA